MFISNSASPTHNALLQFTDTSGSIIPFLPRQDHLVDWSSNLNVASTHLNKPFFWRWFHYIVHLHTRVTVLLLTGTVSASCRTLLASHCNEHEETHRCNKDDQSDDGCHNDDDVHRVTARFFHILLRKPKTWLIEHDISIGMSAVK